MTLYVLSVDPGKATGLALFSFVKGQEPVMIESFEASFETYASWIRSTLDKVAEMSDSETTLTIVCERFTINAQTVKNSQAPYSLEHIGILKQIVMDYGGSPDDIVFQSPADAKAMFDNPKLKKLEYWHRGGEGHALDAIRHGLLCLVKSGWNPLDRLRG